LSLQYPAGFSCWGKPPAEDKPKANFPVLLPISLSVPVFLRNFPVMVSDQQLLANFGLIVIPALQVLSAPFLQVETEPRVDLLPYATLEEACLVLAPGILLLPPTVSTPFCQRQ
jgi:hypothetical protein